MRVDHLEWLSHLPLLIRLGLSGVNLKETKWVQQIFKLSFLEELYLSDCQLACTLPVSDIFANSFFSFLSVLNLSYNGFTSSVFHSFFNLSTHLTHVDISYNQLDGPIPDTFGELNFLEELRVTGNMFHEIPTSLGNLIHLSIHLISDNTLNESLPHLLQKLSGIASKTPEWINLNCNQLVDSFPDITQFSSLKRVESW